MAIYLRETKQVKGPFLVVCPLSIVKNWQDEITKFAPKLSVMVYMGDKDAREKMRAKVVESILLLPKSQRVCNEWWCEGEEKK